MSALDVLNAIFASEARGLSRSQLSRLAAISMVSALTCGGASCPATQNKVPARHSIVGLDVSRSAVGQKGTFLATTVGISETLTLDRDQLTLIRVDRDTLEFYDDTVSDSLALATVLAEETARPNPQGRTLPAPFWRDVAERAEAGDGPVTICLLSDGDNDDFRLASWDDMARSATRLAKNARVRSVVIAGASPKNWARLRQCFKPLGNRLHLMPPAQVTTESVAKNLGLP